MIDKMKEWADWLWDWMKRLFGRSKIIFANVMGIILEGWVLVYDPVSMFDWDQVVDNHQVAVAIGFGIMAVNAILRTYYSGTPASFRAKEVTEEIVDEESLENSPKAH